MCSRETRRQTQPHERTDTDSAVVVRLMTLRENKGEASFSRSQVHVSPEREHGLVRAPAEHLGTFAKIFGCRFGSW